MKATKEEAEEAWKEHFAKRFYLSTPEEKVSSMALLRDYKSALRAEIEKEKVNPSSKYPAYLKGLEFSLELIDTVKPLKNETAE